jgi:hypothetical protein
MARTWCVTSNVDSQPIASQAAQVRLILDSYGVGSVARTQIVTGCADGPSATKKINEIVEWSMRELESHHPQACPQMCLKLAPVGNVCSQNSNEISGRGDRI